MNNEKDELVSIIMPAYNTEQLIGETIDSVINQTYKNWELIIVDDCSTDNTLEVINEYKNKDERIRYYKLEFNSGAAVARNLAIEKAIGKYMAFLDSDDLWFPNKLTKQIKFMEKNNYVFTCTSYTKINGKGELLHYTVKPKKESDYNGILKACPGNSTVIYNAQELGKYTIMNIRKRNDYVMWLKVIKDAKKLYGIQEPLSSHRVRKEGISKKKTDLVKYHWVIYRDIENLSLLKSVYLMFFWIAKTIIRMK